MLNQRLSKFSCSELGGGGAGGLGRGSLSKVIVKHLGDKRNEGRMGTEGEKKGQNNEQKQNKTNKNQQKNKRTNKQTNKKTTSLLGSSGTCL